ncbi:MAG: phycobiliprotein lyase [Cyanobacteriota bacterium]
MNGPEAPQPGSESPAPFPPEDISAFLAFCAGEWLALRSRFALEQAEAATNGDEWHSSERGELQIRYLTPEQSGDPGGLEVMAPGADAPHRISFGADGRFQRGPATQPNGAGLEEGRWTLWEDGSLELVGRGQGGEIRERIWFTKPNLRLRSSVAVDGQGMPGRATFSSEIRRVQRPATPSS